MFLENLIEDLIHAHQIKVMGKPSYPFHQRKKNTNQHLHVVSSKQCSNLFELLQPGSFVKLKNQPNDLPPFQLISCRGGRCWVRQQTWGKYIHWEVDHHRLKSA